MKLRLPTQQKTNTVIKSAVNTMIKNISVIAIFVILGTILMLQMGPTLTIKSALEFKLAVPSIVLAASIAIIYELWMKNGRQSAYDEKEYQDLLKTYTEKSNGLHYPTMQNFLDYERDRRYYVEYDKFTRELEREQSIITKIAKYPNKTITDKIQLRLHKMRFSKLVKARNTIKVSMPYEKSEEFDYLRYNLQDIVYKEYSPNDTKKHLTKARVKKYTFVFTFAIVGLNLFVTANGTRGEIWPAIIVTVLAAASLMYSVVSGFSTGYHNIKVISTGVYNTGVSFLDQAVAYCKRERKDLYYKGATEFREYLPNPEDEFPTLTGDEFFEEIEQMEIDLFTKAEREVTKTDKQRI